MFSWRNRVWTYERENCTKKFWFGSNEYGYKCLTVPLPGTKKLLNVAYWKCYCQTCSTARWDQYHLDLAEELKTSPWDPDYLAIFNDIYKHAIDQEDSKRKKYEPPVGMKRQIHLKVNRGFREPGVSLFKALRYYDRSADYDSNDLSTNTAALTAVQTVAQELPLVSSKTAEGWHKPIIDIDGDHLIIKSKTSGHHHLYLNTPIRPWRWRVLMVGLYVGKVIETGNFWWSMRRGLNFAKLGSMFRAEEFQVGTQKITKIYKEGHEDYFGTIVLNPNEDGYAWSVFKSSEDQSSYETVSQGTVLDKKVAETVVQQTLGTAIDRL